MVAAIGFAGCRHPADDGHNHSHEGHSHENEAAEATGEHSDEIHFTAQQAEAAGLQLEQITPGTFSHVVKTSGQILPALGDEQIVSAKTGGIVFFTAGAAEGKAVGEGQALLSIDGSATEDHNLVVRYAEAENEYTRAKTEYERKAELAKENIVSQSDLLKAQTEYTNAEAIYGNLLKNFSAGRQTVGSPVSGFITRILVQNGQHIEAGQPLLTVSQNRRLQLRAEVSENYYRTLKDIGSANFQTSYDSAVYKLSNLNGRLLSFGKASGETLYIPVTFEFDNTGDIVPGSFVTVYLLSNAQPGVISVPVAAVAEEQGLHFVYLQLDSEGYMKQEVALGQSNGHRVQVVAGLKPGDMVVTNGMYQVRLAAVSSVMPEGHSH